MPSAGQQPIEWDDINQVAVIRFTITSLLDDRLIHALFGQIDQLLRETGRGRVLLNFSGVSAFASYAVGKLVSLNRRLGPPDRLALCCVGKPIIEILDIMSLRRQFHIYGTEQEALDSFV
jgi:anti-anti-sigma regulatory factor